MKQIFESVLNAGNNRFKFNIAKGNDCRIIAAIYLLIRAWFGVWLEMKNRIPLEIFY
ncbi:MAG: type II toxin-antitoxin system HigB family toxin [Bacteroidales bacterium]|jgi:hypothetical protein|nr:type II toxin-antitoxin system HigB family toxin [Bacteroidales bacterium]